MGRSSIGEKFRRLVRFLTTPAGPMDPTVRVPVRRWLVAVTVTGLLLLEWWYFYAVPYSTIPAKPVFWLSFIGWGVSPVVLQWKWRNLPSKRAVNLQGNFFIGFGIVGLLVIILASKTGAFLPVAEAIMPGAMAGGILAALGSLVWQKPKDGIV